MECERCGRENYDESYYCRFCGLKMDNPDRAIDHTSFSRPNNYLNQYQRNSTSYQNNNRYSQQKAKSDEVSTNKQHYRYDNTSTDNSQYEYDNASTDNSQYGYDNTYTDNKQSSYDNTYADNSQQSSYGNTYADSKKSNYDNTSTDSQQSSYNNAYADSKKSGDDNTSSKSESFEYYSTPPTSKFDYENYLAHREPSKFDTARDKVLKINNVLYIVGVLVFAILILLFECISTFHYDIPFFSSTYSQATEPVTEPEDYTAKLSYDLHIVTDSSGEHLDALFPVPDGYKYESSGSDSLATFYRNVNGAEVIFSTSFFKGELQEEIDYYSGLNGEDGKIFNIDVTDTNLGEMTLITLTREDKTTVYQAYIKVDEEYYFHISLSNIPVEYKGEASKLIDLVIENTTIEFIDNENRFKDTFED